MNKSDYVSVAVEIVKEAGAIVEHYYGRRPEIEYKGKSDLVTAADRASEKLVVEKLRARFPNHGIIGEEGSNLDIDADYCWYIDPVDGTTNFAHGYPLFNVSLGLAYKGEVITGVVYDPIHKECFAAERGSGAYLNNRKIQVSSTLGIEQGLFATGFPSARRPEISLNLYFFHQVSMLTHGTRRAGSAALDLCFVACGRLDGFWEFGLSAWDTAAGILMVTEAGGTVSDMRGSPYQLGGIDLVATNGSVHGELLGLFTELFQGKYRVPLPVAGAWPQSE